MTSRKVTPFKAFRRGTPEGKTAWMSAQESDILKKGSAMCLFSDAKVTIFPESGNEDDSRAKKGEFFSVNIAYFAAQYK